MGKFSLEKWEWLSTQGKRGAIEQQDDAKAKLLSNLQKEKEKNVIPIKLQLELISCPDPANGALGFETKSVSVNCVVMAQKCNDRCVSTAKSIQLLLYCAKASRHVLETCSLSGKQANKPLPLRQR